MVSYAFGNYQYQLKLENDILFISALHLQTQDEYEITINKDTTLFENHIIIKNIDTLHKILCDGLNGAFDVKIKQADDEVDSKKVHNIVIEIETTYIGDSLIIQLNPITTKIAKKRNIQKLREELERITTLQTQQIIQLNNRICMLEKNNAELVQINTQQFQTFNHISQQLEAKYEEFIHSQPLMYAVRVNHGLFSKPEQVRTVNMDCQELHITLKDGEYYLNKKFWIHSFNIFDIQKLKNLQLLVLVNVPITNLDFLPTNTLKKIVFRNISHYKSVSDRDILKLQLVQEIVFLNSCGITNFNQLTELPALKKLVLPNYMKHPRFNKVCNFDIEFVA